MVTGINSAFPHVADKEYLWGGEKYSHCLLQSVKLVSGPIFKSDGFFSTKHFALDIQQRRLRPLPHNFL